MWRSSNRLRPGVGRDIPPCPAEEKTTAALRRHYLEMRKQQRRDSIFSQSQSFGTST